MLIEDEVFSESKIGNTFFDDERALYIISVYNIHQTKKTLFLANKNHSIEQGVSKKLEASATLKKGRSDFGVEKVAPGEEWFRLYNYTSERNYIFVSSVKDGKDCLVYGLNGTASDMDDRDIFRFELINKAEPNKFHIICKHNSEQLFCSNTTDGKDNGIQAHHGAMRSKTGRDVFTFQKN